MLQCTSLPSSVEARNNLRRVAKTPLPRWISLNRFRRFLNINPTRSEDLVYTKYILSLVDELCITRYVIMLVSSYVLSHFHGCLDADMNVPTDIIQVRLSLAHSCADPKACKSSRLTKLIKYNYLPKSFMSTSSHHSLLDILQG